MVTAEAVSFGWYGVSLPIGLLLGLVLIPLGYMLLYSDSWSGAGIVLLRMLCVVALVVAASQPFVVTKQQVNEDPQLVILEDSSRSMDVADNVSVSMDDVEVSRRVIATGNRSNLRNGILSTVTENTTYLLVSDMQSTEPIGNLASRMNALGSDLYAVKPSMEEEYAVTINGPTNTVPGAENRFTVRVTGTKESLPEPTVRIGGSNVSLVPTEDEGLWQTKQSFDETGQYRVSARISAADRFDENNRDIQTVEVQEKPDVLIVGEDGGGMGSILSEFYDLSVTDSLPDDISSYYAVILQKHVSDPSLTSYVIEGNGLVFTGDGSTQKGSMDVLPIQPATEDETTEGSSIVLAIDVSASIRDSPDAVQRQKQLAYNLVEMLPFNNKVGAVAYNDEAYVLQEPKPLAINRDRLLETISRIDPGGPSFHHKGIRGAADLLNGTGNIIWISDGKIPPASTGTFYDRITEDTRQTASSLDERLISVVVGDDTTGSRFMEEITDLSGGMQLDASESGRLSFVFNAGGAAGNTERLVTVQDHFITDGLDLTGSVTLYDPVQPRSGADLLVSTTSGRPVLTTWRYGLGRVGAFSADTNDLSQVSESNPSLITRTVAWAVGDPERKKESWIAVPDARWGETIDVTANYPVDGLRRRGADRYSADIAVNATGFHRFAGELYAYSYAGEMRRVGFSDALRETVRATGGEVLQPVDLVALEGQLKASGSRLVSQRVPVTTYFIVLGLLLFITEVGIRKIRGMR